MSDGKGQFKLHPDARIVIIPRCTHCGKLDTECKCGRPADRFAEK